MGQMIERTERLAMAREQLVQVVNYLGSDAVLHWGLSEVQIRIAVEHLKLAIAEMDAAPQDEERH